MFIILILLICIIIFLIMIQSVPIPDSIEIYNGFSHIPINFSINYKSSATYSGGDLIDNTIKSKWTSSNTSVATINQTGVATGIAPGFTNIRAEYRGVTTFVTLTVTDAVPISIAISPSNPAISRDNTLQLTSFLTFSDAYTLDVTDISEWSSNHENIATVNETGVITGVAGGSCIISARVGIILGNVTLFVSS